MAGRTPFVIKGFRVVRLTLVVIVGISLISCSEETGRRRGTISSMTFEGMEVVGLTLDEGEAEERDYAVDTKAVASLSLDHLRLHQVHRLPVTLVLEDGRVTRILD
jgi:hypothetical protein